MKFYTRIITIEAFLEEMNTLDLEDAERHHLSELVDSSLHYAIIHEVLSHLSIDDKKLFLKLIAENANHDEILDFLNQKVENIEAKIQKTANDLLEKLHKDMKEAKKIAPHSKEKNI